jgi:hypothetical protein
LAGKLALCAQLGAEEKHLAQSSVKADDSNIIH